MSPQQILALLLEIADLKTAFIQMKHERDEAIAQLRTAQTEAPSG